MCHHGEPGRISRERRAHISRVLSDWRCRARHDTTLRHDWCCAVGTSTSLRMNALLMSLFVSDFTVTSPHISEGGTMKDEQVFNGFGCSGKNVSPELNWKGAPAGTKSF